MERSRGPILRILGGCRRLMSNGAVFLGLCLGAPMWLPAVVASAKRRPVFLRRLGIGGGPAGGRRDASLWVHALSVGEVRAAQTLVGRLRSADARQRIEVTATTLSGFNIAQRLFAPLGAGVSFFPYDWAVSVHAAFRRISPKAVVLIETDIWPSFLDEMNRRGVPVSLVNWRMSESGWRRFRRAAPLVRYLFGKLHRICVQSEQDRRRLIQVGIDGARIAVTGNIKFDLAEPEGIDRMPERWRRRLGLAEGRRVLVAGSTHPEEEAVLLSALRRAAPIPGGVVTVFAPRHPERCPEVMRACKQNGLICRTLSDTSANGESVDAIVVDTLGHLRDIYSVADAAFIGGSLRPFGGHNPLEAAVWGKPVLFGPDMRDFAGMAAELAAGGGALQVGGEKELAAALQRLLGDPRLAANMGRLALSTVKANRGAVDRTLAALGITP